MFMPDGGGLRRVPGKIGLHAIGGVLEHLRALTCITSPTVNSYRRFADAGFWAPISSPTGGPEPDHRAADSSAPGRYEYRSVDSAVNPYLSFAALLMAIRDELCRNLDPGPPEERNIYEAIAEGKDVQRIPETLGEALIEALEADDVVKAALPGDMYRVFMHYKTDKSGSDSSGRSAIGTSTSTWTSFRSLWP